MEFGFQASTQRLIINLTLVLNMRSASYSENYSVSLYQSLEKSRRSQYADRKITRPHDCCLSNKRLMELGIDESTVDFVTWWRKHLLPARP
ncbi:hypothetical protein V1524DRAFT_287992 [Lipomyces starkeyi]